MKKRSVFPILLSLLLVVQPAFAYDRCSELERKIQAAKSGQKLDEFDWRKNTKNLTFIGEEHEFSRPSELFAVALKIRNSKPDLKRACLFLEVPSSFSISEYREFLTARHGDSKAARSRLAYFREILETGINSGFKVLLVDHNEYMKRAVTVNERDMAMAINIAYRMRTECDQGVMIVGKGHLAPIEFNRVMMRDILKDLWITSTAINLQFANDRIPDPDFISWNGTCPEKSMTVLEPVVFENSSIADLSILPNHNFTLSQYGYFDYTVLMQ